MAVNKDSNSYTFLFAIILILVVGTSLASLSVALKPRQSKNVEIKKKMDIIGAIKIESTRQNAEELFEQYILKDECLVIDENGNPIEANAFEVDIKKDFKDKKLPASDRKYPIYVADLNGTKKFILPMVGKGLWGPIWGYVAVNDDMTSVYGAKFFHQGETPGLGAEIANYKAFQKQFESEVISAGNVYKKIGVTKDGLGASQQHKVDGITGGTITSKGVEEMLDRTLQVYVNYFTK